MTETIITQVISGVAVGLILWAIKSVFDKYRKMNDIKKVTVAFAACEVYGILLGIYGYSMLQKSVSMAIILFAASVACVALTVYMFSITMVAIKKTTNVVKQTTDAIAKINKTNR